MAANDEGKRKIDAPVQLSRRLFKIQSPFDRLSGKTYQENLAENACIIRRYPAAFALSAPKDPFLTYVADKADEKAKEVLGEPVAALTVSMTTGVMRGMQSGIDAAKAGDSQAVVRAVVETGADVVSGKAKVLKNLGRKQSSSKNRCKGKKKNDKACSEPVMAGTGEFIFRYDIVDVPATLPVHCHLYYGALSKNSLPALGPKFTSTFDQYLLVEQSELVYYDDMGVGIPFADPLNDAKSQVNSLYPEYELQLDSNSAQPRYILQKGAHYWRFESFVTGRFDLVEHGDNHQNTIQYLRTDKGQLFALRHSDGFALAIDYNDKGQRSAIHLLADQDNQETLIRFDYHQSGYLKQAHNQFGSSRSFKFDTIGLMTEWRDSQKTLTQLSYDDKHRVVRLDTSGAFNGDSFEYNDAEHITTYRKGDGKEWERLHFDDEGNLIAEENPLGGVLRYEYDSNGNKLWLFGISRGQPQHVVFSDDFKSPILSCKSI